MPNISWQLRVEQMQTKQIQFFLPHTFKTPASLYAGMPKYFNK